MNVASTVIHDGRLYVDVDEFITHLNICCETVVALCAGSTPLGTKIVADTLNTTIDTLRSLT